MISFANILRRLGLYALIILGPLCLAQQSQGGFPELCDQKKAEAESAEVALCRIPNPLRKLQQGVLRWHSFFRCHPSIRPSLSRVRLDSGFRTLRPETFPSIPWAARSLPMLC
jgi:hypothetical protein